MIKKIVFSSVCLFIRYSEYWWIVCTDIITSTDVTVIIRIPQKNEQFFATDILNMSAFILCWYSFFFFEQQLRIIFLVVSRFLSKPAVYQVVCLMLRYVSGFLVLDTAIELRNQSYLVFMLTKSASFILP